MPPGRPSGEVNNVSESGGGSTLLAVDDDPIILAGYRRGFSRLGYHVISAGSVAEALREACHVPITAAVIDLHLGTESGLEVVSSLHRQSPRPTIVVVSGYLSVTMTVRAIREGADHALFKPVTCEEVVAVLRGQAPRESATPTLARAEWEHMMRVLDDCDGNITHAAKRLGLHRQNLQRRLRKDPPPV